MTTPDVIEKSLVDIELKGGLDESGPEETVPWQKRLTKAENVYVDGNSIAVRPGLQLLDSDTGGTTLRLGAMARSLGVVSTDSSGLPTLGTLNNAGTNVDSRGNLPEFSVVSVGSGGELAGVALDAGVAGVVSFTKFKAIAYYGSPFGLVASDTNGDGFLDASPRVLIVVIDLKNGNVVRRYVLGSATATTYQVHMVGADDRYLHIYRTAVGASLKPALTVIDTDNLPAESATLTFTDMTSTANNDLIGGVVPITGGSVAITQGTTTRIERFNNSAASQDTATSTEFTNATGIDWDGTNYYIVGRSGYADLASLSLTGYWQDFTAAPWVGTASAGTSANQNATSGGAPPAAGAALNGFGTADFDGSNDHLLCDDTLDTYIAASASSGWVLFKADAADALGGGAVNAKPCFFNAYFGDNYYAIGYNDSGFCAEVYDGALKTAVTPAPTGAWTLGQWKHDGTNLKVRINSGTWVSTAAGAVTSLTASCAIGPDVGVTETYDGLIASIGISDTVFSDATFDLIKETLNARYALAL